MTFNIFPYIVNTFLKSKIGYNDMNERQYIFLKGLILDIIGSEREYVEYKDMVNIKNVREMFEEL